MGRQSKMMQYVNWRMRVTISDTRMLVGTLMAFDKHMNLVLADTEEYRLVRGKKGQADREQKRPLGFILLRGENVVSLSAEAPPPPKPRAETILGRGGPGVGKPAGRGLPPAAVASAVGGLPSGLAVPVAGVGGPGRGIMQPGMGMGGMGGMPSMPPMPGMPGMGMVPPPHMMGGPGGMPPGGRGMGMPMMMPGGMPGGPPPPPPMMMMGRGMGFPPPPPPMQ